MNDAPTPPDAPPRTAPSARALRAEARREAAEAHQRTWAARFGWIAGGTVGMVGGFFVTWGLERGLLSGRVTDPTAAAARASSVLVPLLFLAGALGGHALGHEGGRARYRLLGAAAGVALAGAAWIFLVVAR
ncbi:MAG: hypothetical protein JNK72_21025 [Myxococcales bacterium]|nr:hypothetical protein [Myxococcales bacterium]